MIDADVRTLGAGIFGVHGIGDLGTTIACYLVLGAQSESNPLMRLALKHGIGTASVVMLLAVGVAAASYVFIGERWDFPGWRAFGLFQIGLGCLIAAANVVVLLSVLI